LTLVLVFYSFNKLFIDLEQINNTILIIPVIQPEPLGGEEIKTEAVPSEPDMIVF
jgi:hypothetical protein